jgi:hypothetical protein
MLQQILWTLACVTVPVIWGIIVNRVFNVWVHRDSAVDDDETTFPDYQI